MSDQNTSEIDLLNPSSFSLPEDFEENPDDYELWSVRAPVKFDISTLNGVSLQFALKHKKKAGFDPNITTFAVHGETYSMARGHTEEVSSFRILKGTDDGEEEKGMTPLPVTFNRHFNVIESSKGNIADIDLAPSNERAPEVDMDKMRMRIPYTPIAQKSGLKRRCNLMGSNATYIPPLNSEKSSEAPRLESPKKSKKSKSKASEKKQKKSKKSSQ